MAKFGLLLWQFYKPLLGLNALLTWCAILSLMKAGWIALPLAIITKILGYAIGTGYQYLSTSRYFEFYRNAGYTVKRLYLCVYTFDFALFLLLTFCYIPYAHTTGR